MSRTLQLKISLMGSQPLIWRQILIDENYRLDRLHQVIQIAMGWRNCHLHQFSIQDRIIGMILEDDWGMEDLEDETTIRIGDFLLKEGESFYYQYDFGDSWDHHIILEKIGTESPDTPLCLAGKRGCPPENSGGIPGFQRLLEILQDENHPDHEDYQNWLEDNYDPTECPLDEINAELKKFGIWHRKHPKAKSTPWHRL